MWQKLYYGCTRGCRGGQKIVDAILNLQKMSEGNNFKFAKVDRRCRSCFKLAERDRSHFKIAERNRRYKSLF